MPVRLQIMQHDGVEAELYLPAAVEAYPVVVLVVAGSSGGLRHREIAHRLAEDGIPALALAYFAYRALPPTLSHIPLEYFVSAIQLLQANSELADARLVAMGSSRGAELVLQLASQESAIHGVIATSPSSVRWGATGMDSAAWTFAGAPLSFVHTLTSSFAPPSYCVDNVRYVGYREWYISQLDNNPSLQNAVIPIERVNGPLLLFSGADDQLWPSTIFADRIEARAQALGFAYPVINVQYQDAGHIFPLPEHAPVIHTFHPALQSGIAYGGTLDGIAHAAADRWANIIFFLHHLNEFPALRVLVFMVVLRLALLATSVA